MKAIKLLATLATLLFAAESFAALVGLTPKFPDLAFASSQTLTYEYVTGKGQNPDSGVLTIEDDGTIAGGTSMTLNADGTAFETFAADYLLTANFDDVGNFVDGSILITHVAGAIPSLGSFAAGSVLLAADIVDFGFSGTGSQGVFDFVYGEFSGLVADVFQGAGGGSVIGSGTEGTIANFSAGIGTPFSTWTQTGLFDSDFSGTVTTNNFVPVPGAFVLFGSALAGLVASRKFRQ